MLCMFLEGQNRHLGCAWLCFWFLVFKNYFIKQFSKMNFYRAGVGVKRWDNGRKTMNNRKLKSRKPKQLRDVLIFYFKTEKEILFFKTV